MATHMSRKVQANLANRWRKMIPRCENREAPDYARYGGRGIRVCPEWPPRTPGWRHSSSASVVFRGVV
jgi:hypothetical protein